MRIFDTRPCYGEQPQVLLNFAGCGFSTPLPYPFHTAMPRSSVAPDGQGWRCIFRSAPTGLDEHLAYPQDGASLVLGYYPSAPPGRKANALFIPCLTCRGESGC